jgi:hypothetical protein
MYLSMQKDILLILETNSRRCADFRSGVEYQRTLVVQFDLGHAS